MLLYAPSRLLQEYNSLLERVLGFLIVLLEQKNK